MKNFRSFVVASLSALLLTPSFANDLGAGQWYYWRSFSPTKPAGKPALGLCISATETKDPAVLIAQVPGDTVCVIGNYRRNEGSASFDMTCEGTRAIIKVESVFSTTEIRTQISSAGSGQIRYVHGRRESAQCSK
jgi:hypothetical protein